MAEEVEKKEEAVSKETASTDAEIAAAAEAGSEVKPAEEVKDGELPKPPEKEKKFTDDDMKKIRQKYQNETRQERDARIAAETEARVLKELAQGKKPGEPEPTIVDQKPIRPKEADFGTREEFDKAMDKYEDARDSYRDAQKAKQDEARAEETRRASAKEAFENAVVKQVQEGIKAHEDFEDVVVNNSALTITPLMAMAITRLGNGHEVQYFLGKNPEEANRLAAIKDPVDLAVEVGALSKQLKQEKPPEKSGTEKTAAPKPPSTVAAKAKVSTDTALEGKTQAERMAILEKASRDRRISGQWSRT